MGMSKWHYWPNALNTIHQFLRSCSERQRGYDEIGLQSNRLKLLRNVNQNVMPWNAGGVLTSIKKKLFWAISSAQYILWDATKGYFHDWFICLLFCRSGLWKMSENVGSRELEIYFSLKNDSRHFINYQNSLWSKLYRQYIGPLSSKTPCI